LIETDSKTAFIISGEKGVLLHCVISFFQKLEQEEQRCQKWVI